MDKAILYKYLRGEATPQEKETLIKWINEKEENEKFFTGQANLWVWQHMPEKRACSRDYAEFRSLIKRTRKTVPARRWSRYAAAVLLCLLTANLILLHYNTRPAAVTELTASASPAGKAKVIREFYTDNGVKARIQLPDSTQVWLNSGTKISYPEEFGSASREIWFSGEAYFDVAKDSLRPMIIHNRKSFRVKVLGTRFNLKNYDNDRSAQLTLYSGKVEVLSRNTKGINTVTTLHPNETVVISGDAPVQKKQISGAAEYAEWKEGKIVFSGTKMPEVIKTLERWHGVTFRVQDPEILEYSFTARFSSESIVQILEFLKIATYIDYKTSDNQIILTKR